MVINENYTSSISITLTLRSLLAFLIGLVGLFDKSYGL